MSSDADNKTLVIFEILKKLVVKQEIYPLAGGAKLEKKAEDVKNGS